MDTLISATEIAEEPGQQAGEFVQEPVAETVDEDGKTVPGKPGVMITDLESAGWTIVYDRETAEPSVINNNMLPRQLKGTRDDGQLCFTTIKPSFPPVRGSIRCMLHEDRPEFEDLKKRGVTRDGCRKATIPSEYELIQHMRNKHNREWSVLEEEKERAERDEDRAFQRRIFENIGTQTTNANPVETVTHPVSTETAETTTTVAEVATVEGSVPPTHERVGGGECLCGKTFTSGQRHTAEAKLQSHVRRAT
tara:strand:+ start:4048 stop:4800 length:753 start_codon:yes stop_codon:yes gene_type:complete